MTLCQLSGVIAVFFKSNSYDYNPIELAFHSTEYFCRTSWPTEDPRSPLSKQFEHALMNCIYGETACNYSALCHINITREESYRASGK
jgi:hypothetical protein